MSNNFYFIFNSGRALCKSGRVQGSSGRPQDGKGRAQHPLDYSAVCVEPTRASWARETTVS